MHFLKALLFAGLAGAAPGQLNPPPKQITARKVKPASAKTPSPKPSDKPAKDASDATPDESPGLWEGVSLQDLELPKDLELHEPGFNRIVAEDSMLACFPLQKYEEKETAEFGIRELWRNMTDPSLGQGRLYRMQFLSGTMFFSECDGLRFQVESAFVTPASWSVITRDVEDGLDVIFEHCTKRGWGGRIFFPGGENQICVSIQEAYQEKTGHLPCREDETENFGVFDPFTDDYWVNKGGKWYPRKELSDDK